tara:strand:+ start:189 stop:1046 length:858 start_codon:yes stop_codon:yes gene_type:complete
MSDFSLPDFGNIFGGGYDTGYLDDFDIEAPTSFDFEPINFLYDGSTPSYASNIDWGDLGTSGGGTTFSDMYPDLVADSKSGGGVDWGNILGKAVETGVPALINSFSSNDSKSKDNPSPQANLDSAAKSLQNTESKTPALKKEIFPVGNSVVVKPDRFIDFSNPKEGFPTSPGFNEIISRAYGDGTLGGLYSASQKLPTDVGEFGWQDAANIAAAYGQGKLTDMALMAVPGAGPALVAINKLHPEGLPGAFKDTGKFLGDAGNEIASGVGGVVDDFLDNTIGRLFG